MTQLLCEWTRRKLSSSLIDIADLDGAVEEVIKVMLGASVGLAESGRCFDNTTKVVTAIVGLAGVISGAFVFRAGEQAAIEMTTAMVGTELRSLDDTVKDAMGEVCNMLAGAWKGRVPALASACLLSVPTVVTGKSYVVHVHNSTLFLERNYKFNDHIFYIRIQGDSLVALS